MSQLSSASGPTDASGVGQPAVDLAVTAATGGDGHGGPATAFPSGPLAGRPSRSPSGGDDDRVSDAQGRAGSSGKRKRGTVSLTSTDARSTDAQVTTPPKRDSAAWAAAAQHQNNYLLAEARRQTEEGRAVIAELRLKEQCSAAAELRREVEDLKRKVALATKPAPKAVAKAKPAPATAVADQAPLPVDPPEEGEVIDLASEHEGDGDEGGEGMEDGKEEGKEELQETTGWFMCSSPDFFPPSYGGARKAKPGATPEEVAAAAASQAAFDRCVPIVSAAERKKILARTAHPLNLDFCQNIPQVFHPSASTVKGYPREVIMAAGQEALVRLPAAIERNTDVVRMISSLYASMDDSTSVEDIREVLRDMVVVLTHNNAMLHRQLFGSIYHANTGRAIPKSGTAGEQASINQLLLADPLFAEVEAKIASDARVAAVASKDKKSTLPSFDSANLDSWPIHNSLSHYVHRPLAHLPTGFDDAGSSTHGKTRGTRGRGGRGSTRGSHAATGYFSGGGGGAGGGGAARATGRGNGGRGGRGGRGRGAKGAQHRGYKAAADKPAST